MNESHINEKKYLKNVFKGKLPRSNPFIVSIGDGKEMFVMASGEDCFIKRLDLISQYRSLYDIVLDLKGKISFSLDEAIDKVYSENYIEKYDVMSSSGEIEWFAYYYIENALFRIEALWDILAQIYNIKYSLGLDKKQVYHSRIFSSKESNVSKYWKNGVPNEILKIVGYLDEEDDTDISEGTWKGNYKYVNNLRNDMTHKISISHNSFSNYSLNFKEHPMFILKRVTECYAQLEDFIYEACESIMSENEDFTLIANEH